MGPSSIKNIAYVAFVLLLPHGVSAQKENALIRNGNRLYKEKQVDQSMDQYKKAVDAAPENPTANYNLGNTQYRKNAYDEAVKSYESGFTHADDKALREKALYNKGLALQKQKKLAESIDAWKQALMLNPSDEEARENLQKALEELKKQQPPQEKNDKKDEQKKQDEQQKKDKQDEPRQPQSKLSKQQVQQLLKALQEREKEVQDKMNQNKTQSLTQPEKDW